MSNKYFDAPPVEAEHPRLRAWRSYRRATGVTGIVVEARREREAFGYGPARLYVDFMAGEEIHRQDDAAWEQELDNWLVNEGARTQTPGGEVTRTMLRLSSRLAAVLRQVGDGYFRSLLIRAVKAGPLGQSESVRKILADLREGTPYDDGKLASRMAEVDSVFTSIARELTDKLKYERDVAEEIFADAVAQYLDERFHVTERIRMFGRP